MVQRVKPSLHNHTLFPLTIRQERYTVSTSTDTAASRNDQQKKSIIVGDGVGGGGTTTEILSLVFTKMAVEEMMKVVPFVCKQWMDVVTGPYSWSEVDVEAWCRRQKDTHAVDMVVKKVVRRSKFSLRRFSTYRMGESGFFFVAHCGKFLKVLKMPMSDISDQMVLNHIKPLPNLTVLDISHCLKISSKGIAAFGNQCKSLVHLKRNMPSIEADCSSSIDDSEAKTIANTMPNLQHIDLCFGRFGDSGVSEILNKCKSLTHLYIQGSWNVELNDGLAKICESLPHFQNPWFDYNNELSVDTQGNDSDESESESYWD